MRHLSVTIHDSKQYRGFADPRAGRASPSSKPRRWRCRCTSLVVLWFVQSGHRMYRAQTLPWYAGGNNRPSARCSPRCGGPTCENSFQAGVSPGRVAKRPFKPWKTRSSSRSENTKVELRSGPWTRIQRMFATGQGYIHAPALNARFKYGLCHFPRCEAVMHTEGRATIFLDGGDEVVVRFCSAPGAGLSFQRLSIRKASAAVRPGRLFEALYPAR